jgi:lysophospholipase L1-like esterase
MAEGAVRLRSWYRHGGDGPVASIYEKDELLGRRPRPGAAMLGSKRSLSINRWGFRGRDIPREKPPGTVRIAAVGDSTTFGMEASSDDAVWVSRVADLLNEDASDRRYDAINAGMPGYSLAACALQLSERIISFDPDVVIVCAITTDLVEHTRRRFPSQESDSDSRRGLTAWAYEYSLLLNLIRLNTSAFRARNIPQQRHDRLDDAGVEQYARRLERIIDICRQRDVEVILCTSARAFGDEAAPTSQYRLAQTALAHNSSLSLAGLNDAYARYNNAVRSVAHEHRVTLVDLDALVPKRRAYFADSIHFSDAGHELAARAIARVISDNRRLGALAGGPQ